MRFEGLSDFSLSWAAYDWKDKTNRFRTHIFAEFIEKRNEPKFSPQADCNAWSWFSMSYCWIKKAWSGEAMWRYLLHAKFLACVASPLIRKQWRIKQWSMGLVKPCAKPKEDELGFVKMPYSIQTHPKGGSSQTPL